MMKFRRNQKQGVQHQSPEERAAPNQYTSQPQPSRNGLSLSSVVTLLYALVILGVAVFASSHLFDWARMRMVNHSVLSTVDTMAASLRSAAQPNLENPATAGGAQAVIVPATELVSENGTQPSPTIQPINVLLLGTDSRADEVGPPLTDTLILLTLDPHTGTAGMLSLPRDLWLPIPNMDVTTKINMAYRLGENANYPGGGPQLAKDTVSSFIGQPVQYYARISFNGFVEVVDLIGGVDVVVPSEIHDEEYPTADYGVQTFHLDAGANHMDGVTALKYVRTRHTDSDYGRARRQQQVIRAVSDKAMRADMIPTLIAKAPLLLYTMRSSIETDMPMAVALELGNYLRDASLTEIRQLVLDGRYGEETYSEEGAWILLPDRTRVRAALNTFFSPVVQSSEADSVAQGDRSWVRIEVLNGTGEPGVATRARDILQTQGWRVVSIDDADRSDYGHTLVINYGIPGAMVKEVSSDLSLEPNVSTLDGLNFGAPVDMRIVVGQDFLDTRQ